MFGTLRVTYVDGREVDVVTRQSDAVRYEEHFRKPASSVFTEEVDQNGQVVFERDKQGNKTVPKTTVWTTGLYFCAWLAVRRDGEPLEFNEWCDTVTMVAVESAPKGSTSPKSRSRSQ